MDVFFVYFFIIVFILITVGMAIKNIKEYQRAVIFRLGRLFGVKGPGWILVIPIIDKIVLVDLRVVKMEIKGFTAITKDSKNMNVDAVVCFKVVAPELTVVKVTDHIKSTSQVSRATLQNIVKQYEGNELFSSKGKIKRDMKRTIEKESREWGVEITEVEIKEINYSKTTQV